MRKALSEPATAQMLAAQSLDPMLGTSNELRDRIQAESQRLGALIKAKGIKLE
jgi:tripartite-type tricarboxylate transporter receptor subunit TctC